MKKFVSLFLALLFVFALAGCGDNGGSKQQINNNTKTVDDVLNEQINGTAAPVQTVETAPVKETVSEPDPNVDIDLTAMSATAVYSEVYNMLTAPESFIGKKIKMDGSFAMYHDEVTDAYYFACIIADATACCSQGIEFVRSGEFSYPEDYPELGAQITVTGVFNTYMEGENQYCTLLNAEMV